MWGSRASAGTPTPMWSRRKGLPGRTGVGEAAGATANPEFGSKTSTGYEMRLPGGFYAYSLIFRARRKNSDSTGTYDQSTPSRLLRIRSASCQKCKSCQDDKVTQALVCRNALRFLR